MTRPAFGFLLLLCGGALAAPGCDNTTGVAPVRDGTAECLSLGELCHDPGQELGGRYEECHDVGHEADGNECLRVYAECKELCQHAPHGEGGAGGEGGGAHGGATH
jgi:hypothetical protein